MAGDGFPKFTNDHGAREIAIGVKEFECIGVSPPHDHPHIYLNMGADAAIPCPYCATLYRFDPRLAPSETEPSGCAYTDHDEAVKDVSPGRQAMSRLLDKSETDAVLKKMRRDVIELLPGRVIGIRHLGTCEPCDDDTQYCVHSILFDAPSAASFFVHFCTKCHLTSYKRKQHDFEPDFDPAVCGMCGYDWGGHYAKK